MYGLHKCLLQTIYEENILFGNWLTCPTQGGEMGDIISHDCEERVC